MPFAVAISCLVCAASMIPSGRGATADGKLMRVELRLAADAARPHVLLMTLGGPIYCGLLTPLADYLQANLVCPDYSRDGLKNSSTRSKRLEDWGDPAYLNDVARLPAQLRARGVKISKLVLVGVSYSGYANAELIATHPQLHPAALVVIDSYLDLASRFKALPPRHVTRSEMTTVLGGTPARKPHAYSSRSPSHHLDGLAAAIRAGTRVVFVWSVSTNERWEFKGATCSRSATAGWLNELAGRLHHRVAGYVTEMNHADALRNWGEHILALAGVGPSFSTPLPARRFMFAPGRPPPRGSYCH